MFRSQYNKALVDEQRFFYYTLLLDELLGLLQSLEVGKAIPTRKPWWEKLNLSI